ncbi:hypothetical protein GGR56DRAFT_627698 [Xylariaceae sp. FL0804]|nr:hypothetical protein GGR56DRAFT_627698 [Xylariaceae sp. FL0804]
MVVVVVVVMVTVAAVVVMAVKESSQGRIGELGPGRRSMTALVAMQSIVSWRRLRVAQATALLARYAVPMAAKVVHRTAEGFILEEGGWASRGC